jgi:molybdate transport system substrate-binding protein
VCIPLPPESLPPSTAGHGSDSLPADRVSELFVKIVTVFPEDSHPPIVYPAAMTKDAKPDAAQYLPFLTTPEAKAVFERYGFRVQAKSTH